MSSRRCCLYFVASPLQYLAARRIARDFEAGSRQILVWYKRGVTPCVRATDWDVAFYLPWPRWEPLPGPFGRHRRLRANLRELASHLAAGDELVVHSAVFDTEAINYVLRGLPRLSGARLAAARILPDGLISIRRYPLSPLKRLLQHTRRLRRLFAPELDYWCFAGDRIGSDAPFCDRIYTLPGLPHDYPAAKAVTLPPLVEALAQDAPAAGTAGPVRALIIGQPLTGFGLMDDAALAHTTAALHAWLIAQGATHIDYKGHPKDRQNELMAPGDQLLVLDEALETWMARTPYRLVAGVRSSALLFARQIYGPQTRVRAFGWEAIRFKSATEAADMRRAFEACGVELS